MGNDTKGVVITTVKDVRSIALPLVEVISKIKGRDPKSKVKIGNPNALVDVEYNPKSDYFSIYFWDGSDRRRLFVCLYCDGDHKDLGPLSISMSLGCWGNSVELMQSFLKSLSHLGDCYIEENDCDEEDFYKLKF